MRKMTEGTIRRLPRGCVRRRRMPKSGDTERICLGCRAPFGSAGPHNRLCDACRRASEDISPFAPSDGDNCGRCVPRLPLPS